MAMRNAEKRPVEPFFGGFILETLTIGMYEEARNAIREYLQNAFDSLQRAVDEQLVTRRDARVTLTLQPGEMRVHDNGVGISADIAINTLTAIGASRKNYRTQAGFRGIGRLAGIAFADVVAFTAKARGETKQTTVTFDARGLRKAMSPNNTSLLSLEELISTYVTAEQTSGHQPDAHFFEVLLRGFTKSAPQECLELNALLNFLREIAPVAYPANFPLRRAIETEAARRDKPLEEANVYVSDGEVEHQVFKAYAETFIVGTKRMPISDCNFYEGNHWWAWVGIPPEPGAIADEGARAVRVRVRNIQIDDTHIIASIFANLPGKTSYARFNEWFMGEVFVDPTYVVPNARRDAFEDDENWLALRKELSSMCDELGRTAYKTSRKSQQSTKSLVEEVRRLEADAKALLAQEDRDVTDALLNLSTAATKAQRVLARALKNDDPESRAQLRSLENRVSDIKLRAVRKLGRGQADREAIAIEAQGDLLKEIVDVLRANLDPRTFATVSRILSKNFDLVAS